MTPDSGLIQDIIDIKRTDERKYSLFRIDKSVTDVNAYLDLIVDLLKISIIEVHCVVGNQLFVVSRQLVYIHHFFRNTSFRSSAGNTTWPYYQLTWNNSGA